MAIFYHKGTNEMSNEINVGDWTVTDAGLSRLNDLHATGVDLHRQLEFNAVECCEILGIDPTTDSVAKDICEEIVLHGTPPMEAIAKLQKHLEDDAMKLEIGMSVWTKTQSGSPIVCKIVGFEDGELLLDPPSHGYLIRRHESEISLK